MNAFTLLRARRYNNCLSRVNKNRLWILSLATSAILLAVACHPDAPPPKPKALTASELHGQRLYKTACASCHHAESEAPLHGPGMQGIFKKQFLPSGAPANDVRVQE